jgi:hypothetical protein
MSDEDAQPTTPEEMARWMVEQTGGEVAGSVVCEREPDGAWYCEVPLRGGRTWEGRVFATTVVDVDVDDDDDLT